MRNKKISLLLAGAMTLSVSLSACTAQPGEPTPTGDSSAAVSLQPSSAASSPAVVTEPAQVGTPAPEPTEAAEQTEPPAASASPAVATPAPATPAPAVQNTPAPAVTTPAPATPAPVPATPAPTPVPAPAPVATKEAAAAFIGQSVSSLIAAIGQPLDRSYAPSCLGDGEDGELIYNGFTVYTYREGNTETVQDVL